MPLLEVKGLCKWYGRRQVVKGVGFHVEPGEVVGLLGPNGAGKTTSFRMTTGQVAPEGGEVWFNGDNVTRLAMYQRARLGMGYLTQETSVFRKLSVEQNILAILEIVPFVRSLGRKLTRAERWDRTDHVLEQFGLTDRRKNNAARLSGGEKRRLEIARCLVCEPLLILLDEPFTGIDPKTIGDIQQIVMKLKATGIGVLLTDHNVREALKITDRSYLIAAGEVRTHGSPQEILYDPIAIQEYLGEGFHDDGLTRAKPKADAVPFDVPKAKGPRPAAKAAKAPAPARTIEARAGRPKEDPVARAADQEILRRLVEKLKGPEGAEAAMELGRAGASAAPLLLDALERRDVDLRSRAHLALQQAVGGAVAFDPFAPEAQRRQQLAALREQMRRAG